MSDILTRERARHSPHPPMFFPLGPFLYLPWLSAYRCAVCFGRCRGWDTGSASPPGYTLPALPALEILTNVWAAGTCGPKRQVPRKRTPPQTQVAPQDQSVKKMERAKQADILWKTNALLDIMEVSYVWKLTK